MIVLRNETYIFLKYGVSVWDKPVVEGRHTRNLDKKQGQSRAYSNRSCQTRKAMTYTLLKIQWSTCT